jgi:hypothetical protein
MCHAAPIFSVIYLLRGRYPLPASSQKGYRYDRVTRMYGSLTTVEDGSQSPTSSIITAGFGQRAQYKIRNSVEPPFTISNNGTLAAKTHCQIIPQAGQREAPRLKE